MAEGGKDVSTEPIGSRLTSAQNNPHAKAAHVGDTCSEAPHPTEKDNAAQIADRAEIKSPVLKQGFINPL